MQTTRIRCYYMCIAMCAGSAMHEQSLIVACFERLYATARINIYSQRSNDTHWFRLLCIYAPAIIGCIYALLICLYIKYNQPDLWMPFCTAFPLFHPTVLPIPLSFFCLMLAVITAMCLWMKRRNERLHRLFDRSENIHNILSIVSNRSVTFVWCREQQNLRLRVQLRRNIDTTSALLFINAVHVFCFTALFAIVLITFYYIDSTLDTKYTYAIFSTLFS